MLWTICAKLKHIQALPWLMPHIGNARAVVGDMRLSGYNGSIPLPETVMLDVEVCPLQALLAETGRGDRQAFTRLCVLVRPMLMSVALRILKCRAWAEEALQDSSLKVWQSAASYVPALGPALTWLKSVVRNHALDLRRQWNRQPGRDYCNKDAEVAADPFDLCCGNEDARRLRGALACLPGSEKEALMLFYFKGCTHAEVALLMGVPLGTVKAWLRRSLGKLERLLKEPEMRSPPARQVRESKLKALAIA